MKGESELDKKAAIYIRVSTQEQATEGYSIQAQTDRLIKYVEAKDFILYKKYIDAGYSASKLERPAMQELIQDVQSKKVDVVIVYKLDRLSRSQKDTMYLIEDIFRPNDVELISMQESFDTSTAFGSATVGMLSVFAQLERKSISERMITGRVERAKKGFYHTGGQDRPPAGYQFNSDNQLIINEYEAAAIKDLFRLYNDGLGKSSISEYLKKKYPGKNKWLPSSIDRMLKNSLYIGKVKFSGAEYDGIHEPIIDEVTFYKTQKEIARRKQTNTKRYNYVALLGGLCECGICGAKMANRRAVGRKGKVYRYYRCYSKKGSPKHMMKTDGCSSKAQQQFIIDEAVINNLKNIDVEAELKRRSAPQTNTSLISSQIESIDKQINKLIDLFQVDSMPLDVISEKIDKLNKEKQSMEKLLERKNKLDKTELQHRFDVLKSFDWDNSSIESKRVVIEMLVQKVIIHDNSIEIILVE
ncbi:recombinase family protein [Enterococcus faecalis]|nr:recombinase family protein [Enterococcus faecalis]EGO8461145.1 recombinase family protein [Enterococcus faecalis]EJC3124038.1 recombinase family protein [Enterococcus faecalis]EKR9302248.1 recombinase family protein [Enterococcus faecalis]EKZ0155427.1 recombinase family protein [Enterococcus faecalis]